MRSVILAVICAVFVFSTITAGYAEQGDWRGGIRTRIQVSRQKIEQGITQGTLNKREARKLNKELGKILNKVDRLKADGRFSKWERERILHDLDRLDRDIYKEKRDGNRRY